MVELSILDLGRMRAGATRRDAIDEARDLACHAEAWGYRRFWVAEHHNMPTVTTAATAVVVGHIAAATKTIRVGAGGVMLPNHAPLIIAEQYGTLETLFPGRIDLGLGRAPGTDQATARALRRDRETADRFPADVMELQALLGPVRPGQRIEAVPGSGTQVPLWILGSSLYGAQLAAQLGLPFGFASHFAPEALDAALDIYRQRFRPSDQLAKPYVLIGVNVIAAETDAQAQRLATSQQMSVVNALRGERRPLDPPIDDIESYWTAEEKLQVAARMACSIIGGPDTVRAGVEALAQRCGADELMVVSNIYDPAVRRRSYEIAALAKA